MIDACSTRNNCSQLADCTNTLTGGYICECKQGFSGDGFFCESENMFVLDVICLTLSVNIITLYCIRYCPILHITINSSHSLIDIDECAVPDSCQENAVCNDTFGSYNCMCKPGFEEQVINGSLTVTCEGDYSVSVCVTCCCVNNYNSVIHIDLALTMMSSF